MDGKPSSKLIRCQIGRIETVKTDVTKQVRFGWADTESLPITRCICGKEFTEWPETIPYQESDGMEQDTWECPNCARQLIWSQRVTVYEVTP